MAKIVGPGSVLVDISAYAPHLPVDGETSLGETLRFGIGGKGNNQMTAAHRLGAETKIIAKRGDDFLGEMIRKIYDEEKISDDYVTVIHGGESGSALIEVDTGSAQNRIIIVKGVCADVTREEVAAAEKDFADCDVAITQLETSMEAVEECKRLAQKYGKPFILNPAPFQPLEESIFDGIDYVTPNETETEFFTGIPVKTPEDAKLAAEKLLQLGAKNVIVTLGSQGSLFYNGTDCIFTKSLKVNAVDTTGAGDAFNGGFAVAIAEKMPIETALKFATCTAAISVTRLGSHPSMPTREEVNALMKQEYGITL